MWQLIKIEAENLCTFPNLQYELLQGVTTLVFGDNRDNDSQRSNGAGKSALLESIAVGITGTTLRKIRSEEIINDASDECHIVLTFYNKAIEETFIVDRRISRKSPSQVKCFIIRGGIEAPRSETIKHSLEAYNRFILEKLGISKEELFNNFILSKYRYENFLSTSDKVKKDIINRFSNGVLVDGAIEAVERDLAPLVDQQQSLMLEMAGVDGRIEMLREQIQREKDNGLQRTKSRVERLQEMQQEVGSKREATRLLKSDRQTSQNALDVFTQVESELKFVEDSDVSIEDMLSQINKVTSALKDFKLRDWKNDMKSKQTDLEVIKNSISKQDAILADLKQKLELSALTCNQARIEFDLFKSGFDRDAINRSTICKGLEDEFQTLSSKIEVAQNKRRVAADAVNSLKKQLAGRIICPKCHHEFLLMSPDFDIKEGEQELKIREDNLRELEDLIATNKVKTDDVEKRQVMLRQEGRAAESELYEHESSLATTERKLRKAKQDVESQECCLNSMIQKQNLLQKRLNDMRSDIWDEVYSMVDERKRNLERAIRTYNSEISANESAIETLLQTMKTIQDASETSLIASLNTQLKEEMLKSKDVMSRKMAYDGRIENLQIQQARFLQFKTYLANTKIAALSQITNEFLEKIGSDIRIRLDGYTALKSGKIKEKISISILREGVECGSFGKFSAGEAARVNLATILAMQKLVNINSDDEKGLDLLVLDEIVDAVDEVGLAAMFDALNSLKITALVISHGNIAEGYSHKLVIVKEHGKSRIGA